MSRSCGGSPELCPEAERSSVGMLTGVTTAAQSWRAPRLTSTAKHMGTARSPERVSDTLSRYQVALWSSLAPSRLSGQTGSPLNLSVADPHKTKDFLLIKKN